jgi:hypothetical protein
MATTRQGRPVGRQERATAPGVRHDSQDARYNFVKTLHDHGVAGEEYRECTNLINQAILGNRASVLKEQMGIGERESLRDYLPRSLIAAIFLAEAIAADKINYEALYGSAACKEACRLAGDFVAKAVIRTRSAAIELPVVR